MSGKLQIRDVPWEEVDRYPDALGELDGGQSIAAMIVRGVYTADALQRVVERIERGEILVPGLPTPYFDGRIFGRILPRERPPLDAYFEGARVFREASRALFDGIAEPFQERMERLFARVAGGRAIKVPVNAAGQPYQPWSMREVVPGGCIDLHFECEAMNSPSMADLKTQIDRPHQLSCVLVLQAPEAGGELSVYGLLGTDPRAEKLILQDRKSDAIYAAIEEMVPRQPFPLRTGDAVLFDAGRYFHRVTPVEGPRSRWTVGSFLALSRDRNAFYYYA